MISKNIHYNYEQEIKRIKLKGKSDALRKKNKEKQIDGFQLNKIKTRKRFRDQALGQVPVALRAPPPDSESRWKKRDLAEP